MAISENISDSARIATGTTAESLNSEMYLSVEAMTIIQWIFFPVLCQMIDVFGIGANVINIICFVKQGFKDPVNVSLLGLAVSDIGCLTTLIWTNIANTPAFAEADFPIDALEVQYLTAGMPHTTFTRVTSWITALITIERCLCIAAPLKVKSIITSTRVSVIIICVFVILISSVAPLYVVSRLGLRFDQARNRSIVGLVRTTDNTGVDEVCFVINNVLIPFSAFSVVIVCTVILVLKLQRKTKWRMKSTTSAQADNISTRNQKVARMIVIISSLFIACFIPVSFGFIAMVLVPGLSIDGKHRNVLMVIGAAGFFMESVNSSVNIFIYYNMSSKYRTILRQIFFHRAGSELIRTITE